MATEIALALELTMELLEDLDSPTITVSAPAASLIPPPLIASAVWLSLWLIFRFLERLAMPRALPLPLKPASALSLLPHLLPLTALVLARNS